MIFVRCHIPIQVCRFFFIDRFCFTCIMLPLLFQQISAYLIALQLDTREQSFKFCSSNSCFAIIVVVVVVIVIQYDTILLFS